jgi:hypothetical protein
MTGKRVTDPGCLRLGDDSPSIERYAQTAAAQLLLNVAAEDQRRFSRTASLRNAGYAVVEASSESQAITAVVHRDVALAILDGDLPQCNVLALGETLQRMRPAMGVVVVPTSSEPHVQWPTDEVSLHGNREAQLIAAVAHALTRNDAGEDGPDPEVVTDVSGRILRASDDGARLLNGSTRGLFQRNLLTFFDAGREAWHDAVRRASGGDTVELTGRLRPRERKPLPVSVRIVSRAGTAGVILEWSIARLRRDG